MNILLVKPNLGRMARGRYVDEGRMEPLMLGVLAGLTPDGFQVELADDRCEQMPYDQHYDLVAITLESFTARRGYEIADAFRARGVTVALGGMHVTLLPEEAASHADTLLLGDAEPYWQTMLQDLRQGCLKTRYQAPQPLVPQDGVLPRRELYHGKGYLPISLIQFGRGCRYRCEFCAISRYFQCRHVTRPIPDVIEEIKRQDRRLLFFVDDNFVADHAAAKALCRAMIPLRIRWVSQASLDMLDDPELMDLLVQSGCLGFVIGFESLHSANLQLMQKGVNQKHAADAYRESVKTLRRYGLQSWAAFTVGHDHDTVDSIRRTCDFAIAAKFTFAAFNILMPYPNTGLYQRLAAENRLLYNGRWWLDPAYRFNHAAFKPRNMTADELTEVAFECRRRFNAPSSILRRLFEPSTNLRTPYRLLTYLIYNPLFRKEVFKKQGLYLGENEEDNRAHDTG